MTIGERIRHYRKKQNMSQEALAENMGITRQAVAKWENGKSSPGTENLLLAAKILHVSVEDLTGPEESSPGSEMKECRSEESGPAQTGGVRRMKKHRHLIMKFFLGLTFLFLAFALFRQFTGKGDSQLIFDAIITLVNLWLLGGFFYVIIMIVKALKKYLSD